MNKTFVITVSGACSGVGKTRLIEMLIPVLANCAAVKARVHEGGGLCVLVEDDPAAVSVKDTGRYLAAGARRAYLISGASAEVRASVEDIIARGQFGVVIVESNEIARHLASDVSFFLRGAGEAKPGADACEQAADVIVHALSSRERERKCGNKTAPQ